MKFKLSKALLLSFLLSICGIANAGIIDKSNWDISNIDGAYARTYTDWTSLSPLNDNEIKTFLSDSNLTCPYNTSWCGVNAISGPWSGFTLSNHSLTIDFNIDYVFTDIDLYSSRAYGTSVNVSFYNDNTFTSSLSFVPTSIHGWQGVDGNVTADRIVIDFNRTSGSSQFIMHELQFNGTEAVSVPEPSTLAIFALGMIGLVSRRFKK